jgi:hypothetical protein
MTAAMNMSAPASPDSPKVRDDRSPSRLRDSPGTGDDD